MISNMDLNLLIRLKNDGYSNCKVAKIMHIHRKTVAKYWNNYLEFRELINAEKDELKKLELQKSICLVKPYNSSNRTKTKITPELVSFLEDLIKKENEKERLFKNKKQNLTKKQIYEIVKDAGFDVSYSAVTEQIRKINGPDNECYIRQQHDLGERLEYDFGNVKLLIDGVLKTYYLAVITAPASNFRWAFLYENAKQEVFLDSHVKFFEMIGGVWKEVVYDNMRNVVTKFLGRNEKELNLRLLELANYYGFYPNVTNAYSGNEKGHVESSVKFIRNQAFSKKYKFASLDEARNYLFVCLKKINTESQIEKEKKHLIPALPKFELSTIRPAHVDKCSMIRVDNAFYSVPEYLVNKTVTVRIYVDKIIIYSNNEYVCTHNKVSSGKKYSVDIFHYLNTLKRKPGAIKDSIALRCEPKLREVFLKYYINNPKTFIDILNSHKNDSVDEIVSILKSAATKDILITSSILTSLAITTIKQTSAHNSLIRRN